MRRINGFTEKECEGCKVVFRARIREGRVQRFCGRACQKLNWPTKIRLVCEWCKQSFLYDKRRAHFERKKFRRFCSPQCKYEHWKEHGKSQPPAHERRITTGGYVDLFLPDHPSVAGKIYKRVYEHRVVMEKIIGRLLLPTETIHHKDGNRANNDPSNLELWFRSQPAGQRIPDLVSYLVTYHRAAVTAALASSSTV